MTALQQPTDVALEISEVTVRFGGLTALDHVGLTARRGEVVGVIGPNGAGKTTFFNVICGFVKPDSGQISWEGAPLRRIKPQNLAKLGISRTLQALGLFPHLTVLENVMVGAGRTAKAGFASALFGLPRSDSDEARLRAQALDVLGSLGIADVAERLPPSLPYPVQKRVALARALASEPRLLLLDEPASGLSNAEMDELGELIRSLSDRMTVLLVEHHMDLVMKVCDSLIVLNFGEVIATGSPATVQRDPKVLEAYLGDTSDDAAGQADVNGARIGGTSADHH